MPSLKDVIVNFLPMLLLIAFWLLWMSLHVRKTKKFRHEYLDVVKENNRLLKEQTEALKDIAVAIGKFKN